MKLLKYSLRLIFGLFIALLAFVLFCNVWIMNSTEKYLYETTEKMPAYEYAIVLGTSKKLMSGEPNLFFYYRIKAASQLYREGKVKKFILSGDNFTKYYNEPKEMRKALRALGVPDSVIKLDLAGYRTLYSVINGKKIAGNDKFLIITQKFHAYRAVFIGRHYNIKTYAFTAKSMSFRKSFKVELREFFARPKAIIDLFLTKKRSNPFEVGQSS